MTYRASRLLPPEPASAARARRFVGEQLDRLPAGRPGDELRESAYLIVSELVANAVAAGACGEVEVVVSVSGDAVEVAVTDTAPGAPARADAEAEAERGRGLLLVAALAAEWGVRGVEGGKQVWARIDSAAR